MFDTGHRHTTRAVLPRWREASVILVAATTCLTFSPAPVAAQDGLAIEVSPLRVELKVLPKATHTQAITLKNDGAAAVRVRARIDDYWLSSDGTPQFKYAKPGEPYSAAAWIRLNPSDVVVKPGEQTIIRASTVVPAGTTDGAYRAAVMFEFEPPGLDPRATAHSMQFRGRVATIVYATVGNPKTDIELVDLQADGADVVATLTNRGRGYVRTKGTLVITNTDGGVVREVPLPAVPVLPESTREVRVPTSGQATPTPLGPGRYTVEVRIDVAQAALLVGETTLEVGKHK